MIILFDEGITVFDNLGIGVLNDASDCSVTENLDNEFKLEMSYPLTGKLYSEIKVNRILFCKTNPYSKPQAFRISEISKPIKGNITINAVHISYDMNGIIVGPISANNLTDALKQLEENTILKSNFRFYTDMQSSNTFKTTAYYNMRSLFLGSSGSLLEKYKFESYFDNFDAYIVKKRGVDRHAEIRYGKNMTDLDHQFSYETLYNYVYPYYHKESSTSGSTTTSSDQFKQAYIVGQKPLQDGWLSFEENGEAYHPVDESPIQIATKGDYFEKVFTWDSKRQRYKERLYNQQITLIEGVTTPEWIYIDWSGLPSVTVKAGASGYFKMTTDTEYTYHDKDDIVYKGSIKSALTSSMIIYYSEVIPGSSSTMDDDSTSVTHTELTTKVMKVDTELARQMKFDRILNLDLTSEFKDDEEINDETLTKKANKYIEENKIGQYKYNTKVSFIDLTTTTENVVYKNFDKIELGDLVQIVYDNLGINLQLRVISIEYDAILNRYSNIELGEKEDTISSSSVQTGDNVSSLSNDSGYTTSKEVNNMIVNTVSAKYIEASNAKLSKAQIDELSTARIKCTGILEASQFEIDKLVAKLLIADDAVIRKTLTAGEIKVSGDVSIKSGEISISNEETVFKVDRNGNLYANSATIQGNVSATSGTIGGFTINSTSIYNNITSMDDDNETGVYIGPDGISLGKQLKIYPTGLITSYTGNTYSYEELTVPEEIKTSRAYKKIDTLPPKRGTLKGSIDIDTLDREQSENGSVFNLSTGGTLAGINGKEIEVNVGDNVITSIVDNTPAYSKISVDEFNALYKYRMELSCEQLNNLSSIGETPESGYIYKIGISQEYSLNNSDESSKLTDISLGQYVVYIITDVKNSKWQWYKFYFNDNYEGYFGITSEGILYANGAVISGDITVKSGEISIVNGNTVFKVDRNGNLYANSATIQGNVSATSGTIGGFTITENTIENNSNSAYNYRKCIIKSYSDKQESIPGLLALTSDWNLATLQTDTFSVYGPMLVCSSFKLGQQATKNDPNVSVYFYNNQQVDKYSGYETHKNPNGLVSVASYYSGSGGIELHANYLSKIPARDIPGIMYIEHYRLRNSTSNELENCPSNPVFGFMMLTTETSGKNVKQIAIYLNEVFGIWCSYGQVNDSSDWWRYYAISAYVTTNDKGQKYIEVHWNNRNGDMPSVYVCWVGRY